MSVCNLEQQVELKKSLEQYSNVLLLKEVNNKSFDYLGITKKVYDAVFSKNKDQPQSLGIVYHIPQILLNLIDVNPEISVTDINGVVLEELKTLVNRVNQNDGLDYLGKKIGVISAPLAAIEAEIANESKNVNVPIITTSSIQDLSVDELVFPEFILKSTGQQLLKDIVTSLPSINQTNPNENFYYEKVLLNLLNNGTDVVNFTNVEYSNHTGFRLLAVRAGQIPNQSKNIYTNLSSDIVVLAVVDNKGNFLHFNENGDIVPEEEGKIAYFVMEIKNEDDLENMRNRMLQPIKASIIERVNSNENIPDSDKEFVITEQVEKAKEYIAKEVKKKQDEVLNIAINAKANKPVLLDITGGSKGAYANTDFMQADRKRAVERPLSEFELTDEEKRSIEFTTIKRGNEIQILPSINFKKYSTLITLKNPKTLSKDAEVLENIIDILTEDPKEFGKPLTATAKKTYINQFIRFDAIKGVVLTKEGLFIDGKKIEDKQEAKNLLREKLGKVYLSFMQEPYANNEYDWYTIGNNSEIQVDKKNYFDFISKRFVPRVAMDITENRKGLPMIVNGYFTFKQADEEFVIATKAKEAIEDIKKDESVELPTIDPNEIVFRSKLLDTIPTTPAQEKRAEEFLNTNPIFDAVDENGVKLLDKDFTRTLVNSDAFASFTKSAVTLYQGASFTHGYHEAWHVFSQLYLTKAVRNNLYKAVSKLKGSFEVVKKTGGPGGNNYEKVTVNFSDLDPTKQEDRLLLEEFIAEEFRIFAINKGKFKTKSAKTTALQKIFNRIWELLKNLFSKSGTQNIYSNPGSKTVLDEMFDVLYKGKDLGMYMPSIENAEFGTLNSGIINEEGKEIFTYQEAVELTNSIDGLISLATDTAINEGNKISQVRNGFVLKAITNPVNQRYIYNVVVKDAFTKKLNDYVAYVKNNAGKVSDDVLNNYKKTIGILRKALVEENYGNINDIQEGKASNNSLIAFHKENSAYKDLFAIADYEQDIDESDSDSLGKTKRADNKSGNQIKSEEEATRETLFLVKSLLKREDDGRLKYNNLGFPEPVDFISTWRVLVDKLGGATTITGLYNNMMKADKMNIAPFFKQLLLKVGNPTVTMPASQEASKLWISLYQSFCLYKMPLMITQYEEEYNDETGATDVKIRVGRATADYYKVKKRDWPSKFAQNTSKFVKTDIKTRSNTINLKAVKKEFLKTGYDKAGNPVFTVDRADWIPFLNSIGLYLSNNSDIKYQLKEQDILYLTQAIGLAEMANMEIDNPIEFFSKTQKFNVKNNKNVDVNISLSASVGRIDYLASLEAQHSMEYATQMVKGASGNLKNTNSLNSTYTKIVNSLNEVTHRGQMYDSSLTGDYQHMYYLNPEFNPDAAANIAVNSLFNLDGTKDENNEITVFDTDGANYRDINGEVVGVPYSKMDPLDKAITDITSMLFYGVQEATSRAAEKKSYHGIKVKNLKTYTGKKAKYLYIDIEAFLRNEEGLRLIDMDTNQIILNLMYPKLEAELKRIKMIKDDADYYKNYQGFEKAAQFSAFDDVLEQTAKKGESLKDRLTTDAFLQEVADKGIRTVLVENTVLRDELGMQILTYFKNLKERYEKHYIKSTGLKTDDNEAKLPEVLTSNLKDRFYANGLVDKSKLESLGEGQEEAIKNAVFGAYTINAWLYHHDMGGLIHTDFFQFNHAKNEGTKRISPYQSPGNIFATDSNAKTHIDTYVKRPYEQKLIDDKVIGNKKIRTFNGKLNTAIIKESVVKSAYYNMYEEMFKNAMKRRGITSQKQINIELYGKGGLDKNGNPTGGRMKPYSEIKDADGQGFMSFDTYRMLKELESDWSPSQEAAYQRIINGENLEPEELQDLFPVYKLGYAGALAITGKYPINSIHKYSLFPLIPNVIKNSVLDEVHKKMISQDTDYIVFETGSKQSYVKASPTSRGDEIFETSADGTSDTSRLKPNFTFTKNPIFIAYLKNQTKINSYFKGQATLASQLRKLFNVGLYNQGKAINKRAEQKTKRVYDLIDRLTEAKKKEILRKINWKEVPDPNKPGKTKLVGNMEDMVAFVKKKLKQQGFTQEQIDYIDTDSNGYVDLSTHPNAPQIEKLLISIINNDIVRLKINGEPLVEVSGAFNQDIKFQKPTKADLETYGTNGLRGYIVDTNGEKDTKGFGVKIALTENYQKLFYTKYLTKDEKGKYKDSGETIAVYKKDKEGNRILDFDASFNRLNQMIKLNEWLDIDNNRLKIRITGVRIPVQGPNSAEFAEVWEFLQPSAGPIIIIPAEIVAKSGTDFDVDKLTTYLKYISSRGTLFEDKYETVEELEEHIKKLEENFDKALLKDVKKQIGDTVKEKDLKWISIKDNLKDFRQAVLDATANKFIGKENYNNLTTKDNKKLLENLQNKKLVEFVKNNLKDAYKIYSKGIKDFDRTEYDKISESIENLYKQKSALAAQALEISLAKEQKRNFTKVIENDLIDAIVDVLSMPEMAEALLSPNDTHLTKYITETDEEGTGEEGLKSLVQRLDNKTDYEKSIITGERNQPKGISPTRMLEWDYNTDKQQDNISGGQGLGIVAVAGTNSNLFRMIGAAMNAKMPVAISYLNPKTNKKSEKIVDVTLDMKLNYNQTKDGAISLSHARDTNDMNSVAEIISQLLNGFVDIGKDEWVTYLQGNPTVIPKILFLIDAGVPFEEIAYFMTNPMIREYVRLEKNYAASLSKVVYGTEHDPTQAKKLAKTKMKASFNIPEDATRPNEKNVYKYNSDNIYGLKIALDFYKKEDKFSLKELKEVAKSSLNVEDDKQKAGFAQYLIIEDMIKDYDQVKMVINPDTNTSPNLLESKIKISKIRGMENSPTLDPKMIPNLLNTGALKPFLIQDFALDLFGPLFPTRNHPKLINFLINTVESKREMEAIENRTGQNAVSFSIKYQNSLYQYIFTNTLKKYRLGQEEYNQIPVDSLINMDQVVKDFNDKNFAYAIVRSAFANASLDEYIEFSLEKEYLRKTMPLEIVSETEDFKNRYETLKGLSKYQNSTKTEIAQAAYESWLVHSALKNNYNIHKLFRSGKDSIAYELMSIIQNNQPLVREYSILGQFKADAVPTSKDKKFKQYLNFTLVDINDMDEKKKTEYKRQLKDLADPSVIKVKNNPQANAYISNFFRQLPMYSFLQSGMNSSNFNLMDIMPDTDYKRVMDEASVNLKNLLDSTKGIDFLKGFKEFYKQLYTSKNSLVLNRGLNWRKPAADVIALRGAIDQDVDNLKYAIEYSDNVYMIDESMVEFKNAVKENEEEIIDDFGRLRKTDGKKALIEKIKNANTDALVIGSLRDLIYTFKGLTSENLADLKTSIDKAIKYASELAVSGKKVIFLSSMFDITPEAINQLKTTQPPAGKTADKARPVFDSLPGKSATPTMTYAGIGSRETPQEVLDVMTQAATYLESLGYTLRSGGAKGADTAFEKGVKSKKQIFGGFDATGDREKAVAHEIHPNLKGAMEASKKRAIANGKNGERSAWAVENLMARNTNQIFGENLDTPVDFVLAYDPSGWVGEGARPQKGGTLQAIEMAYRKGIPVINMANEGWREQLQAALKKKPVAPTTEAPASTQRTFKDEELHQAYIKGGLEAVTKLIKENKKKELNEAKLLSKEVEMLQEFESLNSKSNKTNSENDRVIELYTILKNSKQLDFDYSLNQLNLSTKPQAPVTEPKQISTTKTPEKFENTIVVGSKVYSDYGLYNESFDVVKLDTKKLIKRGARMDRIYNRNRIFLKRQNGETIVVHGILKGDTFSGTEDATGKTYSTATYVQFKLVKPTVEAPVTESTPEGLPNDTYMYYGAPYEIVRDASGKGIDVVGYKGKTNKKLALLEKYNENPDVDPQTGSYFRNKPEEETKTTRSEKLEGDSILDARTQMIDYTSKQRKALLEIESLIDSGKQAYYLLAGYAGTGKTTIAENIARYGKDAGKDVMIIAPTNKAAKVLRDKLKKANVRGIEAQTIHKTIYGAPDELTGEWVKGKPVKNSVIIIDESSMISKDVMQDLLETTDTNNVVVFMGDGFQLEPVGEDSGLFAGKVKEVKAKTELTEVKRQSLDSSILKVATLVRTDDKAYVPQESYEDFKVVRDKMEFINDYKKAIRENEDAVMIVATNAERILMNNIARKEKYKDDIAILNDDDVLMSVANSDAYPNSETFKVKSIIDSSDIMEFTLTTRDGKSSTYDVAFVDVITEDGKDAKIMLMPELDKPSLYHGQVLENAKGEVLKYLQRNELIKATKRGKKLSPTLVIGTYGYAVTAHKSQGSQWSKVFVNQNYVAPTWNAARWYYTAITRAADNVEVFVTNNNSRIPNEKIEEKINQIAQEDVTSQKSVKLKDGKTYTAAQVNSKMLESMGYAPAEIGKILKELC